MLSNNTFIVLLLFAIPILSGCGEKQQKDSNPEEVIILSDVHDGWNLIPTIEGACSDGSPYYFYYRPGSSAKLAVYLQGGGASWNYGNAVVEPSYKTDIDTTRWDDMPIRWSGLFDLNDPRNFLQDYSILVVPYCTGDVLLGSSEQIYKDDESDSGKLVLHNGFNNTMDALDWVFGRKSEVSDIFVFGTSAGSVAVPVYASTLAEQYPEARITAFCDSSGAYLSDSIPSILETWRANQVIELALSADPDKPLDLVEVYLLAAKRHPEIQFLAYNAVSDETQAYFLHLMGEDPRDVEKKLQNSMKTLDEAIPHFAYYLDTGRHHGIAQRKSFYSTTGGSQSLYAWLEDHLDHRSGRNISCCN